MPWQMGDFTPSEMATVHEFIDATVKATKEATRKAKTQKRRR